MATRDEVRARLNALGRSDFGGLPTPLVAAKRFSAAVGREVWIKRDDLIPLATGGNKIRKLAYLVADARRRGADHLVTVGAEQSNHARCVAAVAAIEGLGCDLILGGSGDSSPDAPPGAVRSSHGGAVAGRAAAAATGNLILDRLLGARLHFPGTDDWPTLEAYSHRVAARLADEGRTPYVMPIGGSTGIGALGFIAAYLELLDQLATAGVEPVAIVHSTSSGGTQAGLCAGQALVGGPPVLGISVVKTPGDLARAVQRLTAECLGLVGLPIVAPPVVTVVTGYLGAAYAEPTLGGVAALRLLARTEGIITDPVYSAKALHAVTEPTPGLFADGPVVFWHTGGLPAVFAPQFTDALTAADSPDATSG